MGPYSSLGPVISEFGLGNSVNPWTKRHNREPLDPSSHPSWPHGRERPIARNNPSKENWQAAYHAEQMMWWICLNSALAGAGEATESRMSRHLEFETFGQNKSPLRKNAILTYA